MRISLSSGSVVETVVTLAAALLMTVAGFEMLQDTASSSPSIATGSPAVHVSVAATQPRAVIAFPHVDAALG